MISPSASFAFRYRMRRRERGHHRQVFVCGVRERGLTLVELIVTVAILSILASAAMPIARFQVKRQNERKLRYDLWQMRDAIDKYKDAADKGAFQTKVDSQNYPPDLETLVNGVDVQGKKLRFLRRIPVDPMTGKAEWGLRSMQDDPDSRLLWRAERVRRVFQVPGNGAGRDKVFDVVRDSAMWTVVSCRTRSDSSAICASRC